MPDTARPQVVPEDSTTSRLAILACAALDSTEHPENMPPSSRSLPFPQSANREKYEKPNDCEIPAPPRTPYLWTWWCHECGPGQPLASTRRCLYCSHQFCTAPNLVRSRRGYKQEGPCAAEFDYHGWAAWGAYRRSVAAIRTGGTVQKSSMINGADLAPERTQGSRKRKRTGTSGAEDYYDPDDTFAKWEPVKQSRRKYGRPSRRSEWQPLPEGEREEVSRRKETLYIQGQHSCWHHCDFPSECLHTIYDALARGRIRSSSQLSHQEKGCLSLEREKSLAQGSTTGIRRDGSRAAGRLQVEPSSSSQLISKEDREPSEEEKDEGREDETSDWLPSPESDSSEPSNDSNSDSYNDGSASDSD